MSAVQRGRWTHDHDGGLVVFLIGMRVNQPWRLDRWLPVLAAMPRMLRELHADPARGFLDEQLVMGAGGPTVIQYWRAVEDLHAYAADTASQHRPAWSAFNRRARGNASVGIWHETYVVPAGGHESVYVDTPLMGLAAATGPAPVTARRSTARQRLEGS